jgi:hypothetical protein
MSGHYTTRVDVNCLGISTGAAVIVLLAGTLLVRRA